jgi:hypothetical protein
MSALNLGELRRHYLPGYAWYITYRCYKREFLLKFGRSSEMPAMAIMEEMKGTKRYGCRVASLG